METTEDKSVVIPVEWLNTLLEIADEVENSKGENAYRTGDSSIDKAEWARLYGYISSAKTIKKYNKKI